MKLKITCDWCGKEVFRNTSSLTGKKHHFCSRQCLASYSSKTKNPDSYAQLKDFTAIKAAMAKTNRELNPTRMTHQTREKIRNAKLDSGSGSSYRKLYGKHEHRVVAENMLGRPLLPSEVVHHRDHNKRNNTPENIVVFSSQAAHAKHHAELKWFICELEKMEGDDAR